MNKIIFSMVLALGVVGAQAQTHLSQSFLNVKSLHVSNTLSISNLVMWPGMTNILGVRYTNSAGTGISVAAAGNTAKLLKDVSLWSDRDGGIAVRQIASVPGTTTNYLDITPFSLSGRILGASGANSAVTFVLTPYWKDIPDEGTTFTATTHDFTFAVTAVASSAVTFATNITKAVNWAGAKGVRVRSIVNADTDASSGVYVQELDLTGFRP